MRKLNFWDYLFYTSMSIVLIWVMLKSLEIIHTPFWLQYGLPIGSFVLGILALYYNLLKTLSDLVLNVANLTVRMGSVEKDTMILREDVKEVKSKLTGMELNIGHIDKRLIRVEAKVS